MGLTAQRVVAGIFTGGLSEAGYGAADKYAKDHGVKGGLNEIETKSNNTKVLKDIPEQKINLPPDDMDAAVKARKQSSALQLLTGMGRKSTFLSSSLGDLQTSNTTLGGR